VTFRARPRNARIDPETSLGDRGRLSNGPSSATGRSRGSRKSRVKTPCHSLAITGAVFILTLNDSGTTTGASAREFRNLILDLRPAERAEEAELRFNCGPASRGPLDLRFYRRAEDPCQREIDRHRPTPGLRPP
jgi:hypothetical protein